MKHNLYFSGIKPSYITFQLSVSHHHAVYKQDKTL